MMPPLFIRLRVKNRDHNFGFWFPLFIIGILLLPFILSALIILIILSIFISRRSRKRIWGIAASLYVIITQLKHVYIEVKNKESDILIQFI